MSQMIYDLDFLRIFTYISWLMKLYKKAFLLFICLMFRLKHAIIVKKNPKNY